MFMAAAKKLGVAEEVVLKTTPPAKKRTRLLKKGLETPCKNMLLLAVDPGLKEAMPLMIVKLTKVEVVLVLLRLNIVILAFFTLLIGESLTCCKQIHQGDIITSFLFAA